MNTITFELDSQKLQEQSHGRWRTRFPHARKNLKQNLAGLAPALAFVVLIILGLACLIFFTLVFMGLSALFAILATGIVLAYFFYNPFIQRRAKREQFDALRKAGFPPVVVTADPEMLILDLLKERWVIPWRSAFILDPPPTAQPGSIGIGCALGFVPLVPSQVSALHLEAIRSWAESAREFPPQAQESHI